MRADHQMALRQFVSDALAPLLPATSTLVTAPVAAVVAGVEHRINVAGHVVRYTVQPADGVSDIAAGLVADAADLSALGITATDIGGGVLQLAAATAFPVAAEPPLTQPAPATAPAVVWARENAPQPDSDYATLDPGQDRPEGRAEAQQAVDATMGTTTVRSLRVQEFTLLLLGSWPGLDANAVRRALESPASVEALLPYAVRSVSILLDATAQNDTMYAPRIALGITLAYADSRRVAADAIENVEATGAVGAIPITVSEP